MVQAIAALLDFCHLVRCSVIDEDALGLIQDALIRFHEHHEIFRELGIRPDGFSLPRQHSLVHYPYLITQFGAPNGLCSSITDSKHIKAVKKPYRRSSRNKPLGQMLVTNQRIDKIASARIDFTSRGMLQGPNLTAGVLSELFGNANDKSLEEFQPHTSHPTSSHQVEVAQDDDHEAGPVDEPESLVEVKLAKTHGAFPCLF